MQPKPLTIELLAIDLNSCTRCVGSKDNINLALKTLEPVLAMLDVAVTVKSKIITTEADALEYRLQSSPTIRINGRDIVSETAESVCGACSDLCGCEEGTLCRVWHFRGEEYTEAPTGLIVDSIFRALYREQTEADLEEASFSGVPENLLNCFSGMAAQAATPSCCTAAELESCCEPAEKPGCCDEVQSSSCSC